MSHNSPFLILALFCALLPPPSTHAADPSDPPGWKLVWSDEFDGSRIDTKKWKFDLGNGFAASGTGAWVAGWGNSEREYDTGRPENVWLAGGLLHIRARREAYRQCDYTSARLTTQGLFAQRYGRFEARARLPAGRGLWPAIWMLPERETYGGWAASGEIDILEARGQDRTKIQGTLHFGGPWPASDSAFAFHTFSTGAGTDEFHLYALEWDPDAIRWYVDGLLYATQQSWWSSSRVNSADAGLPPRVPGDCNPWPAPFDKPFHLLINLAVGGNFAGPPSADTPFPAEMLIDYVRVYERTAPSAGASPPVKPASRSIP